RSGQAHQGSSRLRVGQSVKRRFLASKKILLGRVGASQGLSRGSQESAVENHIVIESADGTVRPYIARPVKLPAPAVVVLQELFGVNADIRATCDELAKQGFIAIAPDLFWRQEPDIDLDVRSEADWQHGLRLYGAYDRDAGA